MLLTPSGRKTDVRRSAIAGLAGGILAGCMVGPDYVKPKVDAPSAYIYEPKQTAETANTEWWQQFGDPVLDKLIADSLASNKNVKIAAANVEQAAGVLTQTRSPLYPQVNYQGDAARQRQSQNTAIPAGSPNPANNYQVLAGATWEIDLWGRVRRLTEAAQANLLATEEARRGVILSLVAAVGTSYLQLRGLDEQLVISKRTLDTYSQSLKYFELKFKYGQISQMNVEQVKVQYQTAAAQIPLIKIQIAQLENAISILLGNNPGPIPRGKSLRELALPEVPAGLPSQLLERRPDLLQAEQQLIAANAQIGAAKAQYYPSISLTAAFGVASSQLDNLFKGPAQVWNYGGSIIGPIFTGGAISGQVAQATAGQKAALLSYEAAIQSAFADVENALVSREQLAEQIVAQEALVQALREYSRFANLQYNGGYAPYTDVLQAEQQLFPAELNLAAARTGLLSSVVRIYQATGGGWVDIAQKTADAPPKPADASTNAPAKSDSTGASDRIEVVMEGDTSVVNVYHGRGTGGAELRAPKSGWPPRVIVRLRGFAAVASFSAESTGGKLNCAMLKNERSDSEPVCQLGSTRMNAISKRPEYIEVILPASLLKTDGAPVEVRWAESKQP
jgi:outer membrane protein, multidrug efflux system